jgi:2-phospho-L-lactate/phosphoenolpyruvate guanylyltransferase
MSCWALVPVKARGAGKQRLGGALDELERAKLVETMLAHVLAVLRRSPGVDAIAVVTPDRERLPADVLWLEDPGPDVNAALHAALAALTARGAHRAVLVSADLPKLEAYEVTALIEASERHTIALAPDRHGSGTNAIALALPSGFRPQFGPASLTAHVAEAARLGARCELVRLPGLACDVDEPEDLGLLAEGALAPRRRS